MDVEEVDAEGAGVETAAGMMGVVNDVGWVGRLVSEADSGGAGDNLRERVGGGEAGCGPSVPSDGC